MREEIGLICEKDRRVPQQKRYWKTLCVLKRLFLTLQKDTTNPLENRPKNFEFARRILTQPQRTCLSGFGDHIAIFSAPGFETGIENRVSKRF
jgi:hypothetical protein